MNLKALNAVLKLKKLKEFKPSSESCTVKCKDCDIISEHRQYNVFKNHIWAVSICPNCNKVISASHRIDY